MTTPPPDYTAMIGERLRAARNRAGLTLAALEGESGGRWKAAAVGSYERGTRGISVVTLCALAHFYGMPPSALMPDEDDGSQWDQGYQACAEHIRGLIVKGLDGPAN